MEKDTMCSFGIRLHLNKAYPEISRGVDVTFRTKWQNRAHRNTVWTKCSNLKKLKLHSQLSLSWRSLFFCKCEFIDMIVDSIILQPDYCCRYHWGLCIKAAIRGEWKETKADVTAAVISVGNYLHAPQAITLNNIKYNGSQNDSRH